MRAQYVKLATCHHCNKEYQIARSDQKFCSTSHRSANHSLKKRLALKLASKDIPIPQFQNSIIENEPLLTNQPGIIDHGALLTESGSNQDGYKPNFLKDTLAAAIPSMAIEGIKSFKGVNNSDIMEILKENKAILLEINNELKALKDELKVKKSEPNSEKYTPVRVTLLN